MKMPLPDKIANKPVLRNGLGLYYKAFTDLTTDRAFGMSEGPIRWTAIDKYGYRHRFFDDEFDRLAVIIQGMDSAYLSHRNKQQNKKTMGVKNRGVQAGKPVMRQT